MIERSRFLAIGFLAALLFAATAPAAEPATQATVKRPNILFIFGDDQSTKTVSCYPGAFPFAKTPHIDALAARGIRFSGAYCGSWCMPSRATLLTGLWPHKIESMSMSGKYPGSSYDPAKCPFWPSVFRQAGYHTAQIGKWHTGVDAGTGRDWDHQIVWNRPKHPEDAGRYYGPQILAFNGEEKEVAGYSTDNYTEYACEYIQGKHRDADKPWYLWLCYGAIHGPSTPAPRHVGAYREGVVPVPADIFPPRPGKPSYLELTQAWTKGPNGEPVMGKSGEAFGDDSAKKPRTLANWARQMNECAIALDEGVGKVLAALEASGQLENTLVIYTADQGFSMGEHGFRTKLAGYDANYRSPLVISMPGKIPAGKVCPHPVGSPDLVRLFFQVAGLEMPWKMHGRDISPLLSDPETKTWDEPLLFEHTGQHYGSDVTKIVAEKGGAAHSGVPWYVALRHGPYKYIRYLKHDEIEELYDLEHDPEELTNLALSKDHEPLLAKLRQTTLVELREADAEFIDQMPRPRTEK